jgi:predicted amidohydrolase
VRVALAQIAPRLGRLDENVAQVLAKAALARKRGAQLALFPELALSGYFLKDLVPEVALSARHPALKQLAAASKGMDLAVGGVWEDARHCFSNALLLFRQGRLAAVHAKAYLPTYGMFDEARYFAPGDGPTLAGTALGTAGLLVCEDAWHAVMPLAAALGGASVLLVASSSPARGLLKGRAPGGLAIARDWQALLSAWALSLGVSVLFCNRAGFEDGVGFWGGSMALGPDGSLLAQARFLEPDLLLADLDARGGRRARMASPLLRDERLDMDVRLLAGLAGFQLAPQARPKKKGRA